MFTPVLAKHSKNFSLQDSLSVGVDRMQRNFEPMRGQVERWRSQQLTDASAKLIIYRAFVESDLEAPKHLKRRYPPGLVSDIIVNREKAVITGPIQPSQQASRPGTSTPRFSLLYGNGAPEGIRTGKPASAIKTSRPKPSVDTARTTFIHFAENVLVPRKRRTMDRHENE